MRFAELVPRIKPNRIVDLLARPEAHLQTLALSAQSYARNLRPKRALHKKRRFGGLRFGNDQIQKVIGPGRSATPFRYQSSNVGSWRPFMTRHCLH